MFLNNLSKKDFIHLVNKNTQNHNFVIYNTIEEEGKYLTNNELIKIKVENIEISCQKFGKCKQMRSN